MYVCVCVLACVYICVRAPVLMLHVGFQLTQYVEFELILRGGRKWGQMEEGVVGEGMGESGGGMKGGSG